MEEQLERAMIAAECELTSSPLKERKLNCVQKMLQRVKSPQRYFELEMTEECKEDENGQIEEAKKSQFLTKTFHPQHRKQGICEQTRTERFFVYKTLKHYVRMRNLNAYHLI